MSAVLYAVDVVLRDSATADAVMDLLSAEGIGSSCREDVDRAPLLEIFAESHAAAESLAVRARDLLDSQAGDCIVEIDPGMSFGTWLHPTTRACLAFLDERSVSCTHDNSLFVAGCLAEQYAAVRILFEERGFREHKTIEQDGWTSGWLTRDDAT